MWTGSYIHLSILPALSLSPLVIPHFKLLQASFHSGGPFRPNRCRWLGRAEGHWWEPLLRQREGGQCASMCLCECVRMLMNARRESVEIRVRQSIRRSISKDTSRTFEQVVGKQRSTRMKNIPVLGVGGWIIFLPTCISACHIITNILSNTVCVLFGWHQPTRSVGQWCSDGDFLQCKT